MQGTYRGIHAWYAYSHVFARRQGVFVLLASQASASAIPKLLAWCAEEALVLAINQGISLANSIMHVAARRLALSLCLFEDLHYTITYGNVVNVTRSVKVSTKLHTRSESVGNGCLRYWVMKLFGGLSKRADV